MLAAILHLGNVEIKESGKDKSSVSVSHDSPGLKSLLKELQTLTRLNKELHCCVFQLRDPHLAVCCELLAVSAEGLVRWLCHRRIVLVAETVVKPVTKERAVNARDALAKHIYALLFDCIINKINAALRVPGKQHAFIGVLDIYG